MLVMVLSTTLNFTSCSKDDETEELPSEEQNDFKYYGSWIFLNDDEGEIEGFQFNHDNTIFYYCRNGMEGNITAGGSFKVEGSEIVASYTDVKVWADYETFRGFKDKTPTTARLRIQGNSDGTLTIYNSLTKKTHVFEVDEN